MAGSWINAEITGWQRFLVGRRPVVTLLRVAVVVVLYFAVFRGALQPIQVVGASMEPNYHDGQRKLLNRWAYRRAGPRRGDVVAIRMRNGYSLVLKRIVGLPGERVVVRGGRVYVDGELLQEPYAWGHGIRSRPPELLGPDQYFAIGDNRSVTAYDIVGRDEIIGRAW